MSGPRGKATMIAAAAPMSVVLGGTAAIAVAIAISGWRGGLDGPMSADLLVGGVLANVAAGAVGRSVVDFLGLGRWPTFNLADAFLRTGVALVAVGPARTASVRARATEPTDRVSP